MSMAKISEDEHFQLLAFLLTSARGCVDEPAIYGPLRLIDAAERLINIIEGKHQRRIVELEEIRELIQKARDYVVTNEEEFIKALDQLTLKISRIIKRDVITFGPTNSQ